MGAFSLKVFLCYNEINGDALEQTHMAQSLEEYTAQASQAYLPSRQAIQDQLGSLDSQLNTAQETINRNYAQQQQQLERQRNQAAEASSLAAAGSGGSFGGAGNLARRKYYEQSFVPAQTQLQTNQANELANARQNFENQRTSLNSQLANLEAQANQMALQQYWAEREAEKQRAAQRAAAAASSSGSAWDRILAAMQNGGGNGAVNKNISFVDWLNDDSYGALNYAQGNSYQDKVNYLKNLANLYTKNSAIASKSGPLDIANKSMDKLYNTSIYKAYQNWRNS